MMDNSGLFFHGSDSRLMRSHTTLGEVVSYEDVYSRPGLNLESSTFVVDSRHRDKTVYPLPGRFEVVLPCKMNDVFSVELVYLSFPLKVDLSDPYVLVASQRLASNLHLMPNQTRSERFEGNSCNDVFAFVPVSHQYQHQGLLYVEWRRELTSVRAIRRYFTPGCKLDRFDVSLETFLPGPAGPTPPFQIPFDPNDVVVAVFEIVAFRT